MNHTKIFSILSVYSLFFLILLIPINSYADTSGLKEWDYTIVDFNGDGYYDVLVVSPMGRGNRVWLNNGAGEYYPSDQVLGVTFVGGVAVADLDGDNDDDIFIANLDSPDKVWLNNGNGYLFESGQEFGNKVSAAVALGDIDADGDMDAAVLYANSELEIFSNNGVGIFFSEQVVSDEKGITSIELRDINNDNSRDILCFIRGKARTAFINNGNLDFMKYEGNIAEAKASSGITYDLTGDDRPDGIFINNEGEPSVAEFYRNEPVDGATGGPDSYGYVWVDSSYSWVNAISNTWTAPSEDSVSGAIPLGFTFNFYGNDYTSIYIASDGYIQFSSPYASWDPTWPFLAFVSNNAPNNAVYGYGTDLDPTAGGDIFYAMGGSAPNRHFVVTWHNVYTLNDDNFVVFQIVLYETTNRIRVNYQWVTPDWGYASIGIENADGSRRLLQCYLFCYPPDNSSITFYLAPEIDVSRSGTSMPTGSSYNFGRVAVGNSSDVTFTITNTGMEVLNLSSTSMIGTNASQFSITGAPTSPVAALGGTTTVTVRFQPTAEGVMEARLQINNNDPDESPYIINLYGGGDDNAPTVTITHPADGSSVTGTDTIDATATDDIGINRVEFYRDSTLIGTDYSSPYSITHDFSADPAGTYLIKAIAYDTLNQTGMDAIKVTNTDDNPTVTITNPTNGEKVYGVVSIEAIATDTLGIDRVEFYVNGNLRCTDTAAPYQCSWDTRQLPFANYTIRAVAVDTSSQTGVHQITVTTTDGPPEVEISEPANGADITGVTLIKADATDNSEVVKVDFYINGSKICSDTEEPYVCAWDALAVPAGSYIIKVVATDDLGQKGSDQITVNRRVGVDISVIRKTEKVWIVKKDYAEITVTLPDFGVADVARLQILRSKAGGSFETIKDILSSDIQGNIIQILDKYLESGTKYTYKVIIFDSNWQLIGESSIIVI